MKSIIELLAKINKSSAFEGEGFSFLIYSDGSGMIEQYGDVICEWSNKDEMNLKLSEIEAKLAGNPQEWTI